MGRFLSSAERQWRGIAWPRAGELLISEIFGPTIQGEGPSAGQAATFLRLGACNLTCSWCDTAYTWDTSAYDLANELHVIPTEEAARELLAAKTRLVVITGGEPALQATEAANVAVALRDHGRRVEIETSGTVPLGPLASAVDLIVVSPKLANSGLSERQRLRWPLLEELSRLDRSVFKFVVTDEKQLPAVDAAADHLGLEPDRVWIMPEGTTRASILDGMSSLSEGVFKRGWSLSPRLHVLIWGNERGR